MPRWILCKSLTKGLAGFSLISSSIGSPSSASDASVQEHGEENEAAQVDKAD